MLIVTNSDKTELLLETNYERYEELNGKALQISFSSFRSDRNAGYDLLDYEVLIRDEDNHEYKVKQFWQNSNEKRVTATHVFYELSHQYKYNIYGGTHTLDEFASWVLEGTGWTFENSDVTQSATLPNFGGGNIVTLLQTLASAFECEFQILPDSVIRFAYQIGDDRDLQYRYKHNISSLSQSVDTTSLKTQITGYGANDLIVTYTSELAQHERIGVRVAEPLYAETVETVDELTELLKAELPDAPETVIEISVVSVDGNVGDIVHVIHEELDLCYQTRILSKKNERHYADSVITVGNTYSRDIIDVLVNQKAEIDKSKQQFRSRFEQMGDRITLEVEEIDKSIATLEIRADQIATSVVDLENNLTSTITQTADTIRSEVAAEIETVNGSISTTNTKIASIQLQTDNIASTVSDQTTQISNLGTRVSSTESSITQHASQIASKVSTTDYNGNTIASLINQTSTTVTIDAEKINLNGAVIVDGSISGATDIATTNNAVIGNAIYFSSNGQTSGSYDYIKASGYMTFESWGDFTFNGGDMYLNGNWIPYSRTDGLSFGYSSGTNRLYVTMNGTDMGYVSLTTD